MTTHTNTTSTLSLEARIAAAAAREPRVRREKLTKLQRQEKAASYLSKVVRIVGTISRNSGLNTVDAVVVAQKGEKKGRPFLITRFDLKDVRLTPFSNPFVNQELAQKWAPKFDVVADIQAKGGMLHGVQCNVWEEMDESDPTRGAKTNARWNQGIGNASPDQVIYVTGFPKQHRTLVPMDLWDAYLKASNHVAALREAARGIDPADEEGVNHAQTLILQARREADLVLREVNKSRTYQTVEDPDALVPYGFVVIGFRMELVVRSAGFVQPDRPARERQAYSVSDLFEMEDPETAQAVEDFIEANEHVDIPAEAFRPTMPTDLPDPFKTR